MTSAVLSAAYVVGVVPAGSEVPDVGADGPLQDVRLVESGPLAAVVGTPPADRPFGRAADLVAHDRLLAGLVENGTPVLPVRFGTVMADDAEVATEVLDPARDALLADLDHVAERVQYTIKVRYEQDAVLAELLDEDPEIRRAQASIRTRESFDAKLRLGQLVVEALEQRRPREAEALLREIGDQVAIRVHEPATPDDVLTVAYLVDRAQCEAFENHLERVAERHTGRLRLRLVGPSAAYDFVGGR